MKRSKSKSSLSSQENVWDYPRPPAIEQTSRRLQVSYRGRTIADTVRGYRVLETSHPPGYYLPPRDVITRYLIPSDHRSHCEWKGEASYFHISDGEHIVHNAVWTYLRPSSPYLSISGYFAFYPHLVNACFVDAERVLAQEGGFYGGWITREINGPYKGGAGTQGW